MASILQASRKSHQEHAIDTFRRQQLAKGLKPASTTAQPYLWGAFFELGRPAQAVATSPPVVAETEDVRCEPACSRDEPAEQAETKEAAAPLEQALQSASTPAIQPCHALVVSVVSRASVSSSLPPSFDTRPSRGNFEAPRASSASHRYSRQLPTRGSSTGTASSAAAAISTLLGGPVAATKVGSTRGQSRQACL